MIAEDRLLKPTDRVYDLLEVVDDGEPVVKKEQEIIVIDGRGYDRPLKPDDKIYNLYDVVEEGQRAYLRGAMEEEMRKIALETAERIARELLPEIAERVIREEIAKLKSGAGSES